MGLKIATAGLVVGLVGLVSSINLTICSSASLERANRESRQYPDVVRYDEALKLIRDLPIDWYEEYTLLRTLSKEQMERHHAAFHNILELRSNPVVSKTVYDRTVALGNILFYDLAGVGSCFLAILSSYKRRRERRQMEQKAG